MSTDFSMKRFFGPNARSLPGATEHDRRLIVSGIPVFLLFSLLWGHFAVDRNPAFLSFLHPAPNERSLSADDDKIYPVLVEQEYAPPPRSKQIRALSDKDAEGQGRLTAARGFNTMSSYDVLEIKPRAADGRRDNNTTVFRGPGNFRRGPDRKSRSRGLNGRESGSFKIPANYRFQQDMRLNFDGSGEISIPRKRFPEFHYFQRMLRTIQDNFAPPGDNFVRRDYFGYTIHQTIKPQVVKVLFLIDPSGEVRDVRVVPPVVQESVADSCIMSVRGRNFGPPPRAVLDRGGVIGINFIFPPLNLRR